MMCISILSTTEAILQCLYSFYWSFFMQLVG